MLPRFVKVFPHEYKRVLGLTRASRPYIVGQPVPPSLELAEVQHG